MSKISLSFAIPLHRLPLAHKLVLLGLGPGPPALHVCLDNGDCRQYANSRNRPRNNLNNLDLMAQTQPTLNLALELVKVVGDACVCALNIAPDLVDEHARDDPEDGGDDQEDLT